MKNRPEILSPVGSMEAFYAAINSGCDAIYLAGEMYGARKATTKFSLDEIKNIIMIAHKYMVKVYVTINTLIFDNEIDDVLKYTDKLYYFGADAVLIQDMGLINIFSKRYKDLELHISTQANVKTLEEIKFFENQKNIKRVVLARETSIEEIKRIKENTSLEIEVFVHGAICMGYSGNCLFSSLAFNRSGNRGECAQPCRLKYSLFENDKLLSDNKYLLSPKELSTIEYIDELIDIGVDSFKIEGRIKSPEYVSLTTLMYKEKVLNKDKKITESDIDKLKRAYNRDFTKGYVFDIIPSTLVNDFRPNNMGVYLGKVISNYETLKIKLVSPLNRLDGIRIISKDKEDYGMIVDKISLNSKDIEHGNIGDIVELSSHKMPKFNCRDLDVFVTSSVSLKNELKEKLENKIIRQNIPLDIVITLKKNDYPHIKDLVSNIELDGDFKVLEASNKPIGEDVIRNQIDKLQDTPFYLNNLKIIKDDNIFLPLGVINNLRRYLTEKIILKNDEKYRCRYIEDHISFKAKNIEYENKISIKVETIDQFIKSYEMGFKDFYIYNKDLYNKISSSYKNINITFMLPRIIEDYSLYKEYENVLVNEVGSFEKANVEVDSYLNVLNIFSANYYFTRGAKSITLSHEMNKENILKFISRYKETFGFCPNVQVTIYDKVDLMIMKYCLISGHYKTKPYCNICKNNKYTIKDRNDTINEILKTDNCGNRILNSKKLCLFDYLNDLKKSGIKKFRINFTTESKEEVENVLNAYKDSLSLNGNEYTYGRFLK